MAKLPEPPAPEALRRIPPEIRLLPADSELWRVYFREGNHPGAWNRFRGYGPLPNARFDHHEEPPGVQDRKVLYAASGPRAVPTCIAEVFQKRRVVNTRRNEPWLVCLALMRDYPCST